MFLVDSPWLSGLCKRIVIKTLSTENGEMPQWVPWSAFHARDVFSLLLVSRFAKFKRIETDKSVGTQVTPGAPEV